MNHQRHRHRSDLVRMAPPVEGKLVGRVPALEVGRPVRVELAAADVDRGFIDFVLAD
jgi:exoribonuclease-2